jgi:beta-galactosidase
MKMKKLLSLVTLMLCTYSSITAQTSQLFDNGWQFTRNGKTVSVNLPHDWDIYEGPDPATGATKEGGGWFPGGKGEYRKAFATPKGEIVWLHFEGVYQRAEVFINGQKAGQHGYGYTPFTVDVTPFLYKDKRQNELLVKVDNSGQPNCRWYSGSGIYRHVWLQTLPALHIDERATRIWTPRVSPEQAQVNLQVGIENTGQQPRRIDDIEVTFLGGNFKPTPQSVEMRKSFLERHRQCPPNSLDSYGEVFTIDQLRLWSPDSPYLYEAVIKLKENGRVTDERHIKFGIRSFSFTADKGFVLNGKPLLINGACVHHDDGVLGAMAFDAAEIRKVRQMKEAGFNLIRTSHNPTTRAFLDACDSIGMLVIDEAFDGWRSAKTPYDYSTLIDSCYREDIHAMVLRDRNHPSVVCWSIGNEVIERKDIRVITTARQLKRAILETDDTRPVTEALCAWDNDWEIYDPHAEVLDVVGYNYMIHKHASDHQRDPKRVMWQTESYPRDAFRNWALTQDHPYIVGDIVWTGLDYLGESGIGRYYYEGERPGEHYVSGGQPDWHGAYCGDVDITGWRKPISHYREMLWRSLTPNPSPKEEGSIYLAVREPDGYRGKIRTTAWSVWPTWESWNWPGWEGKPIDVEVYTKAPEVKLYLNNQLIGTKSVSRETEYKAIFTIPYAPGTLRAEVTTPLPHREGLGVGLVGLSTAGDPARLRLTPDRRVITADGQDLCFITVEAVDSEGRVCPDAAIPCEAIVKGQGSLIAFASADLKDREPYTSPRVTTWKGRALLVVRSTMKRGRAQVSIKSSLPTASLTIQTINQNNKAK